MKKIYLDETILNDCQMKLRDPDTKLSLTDAKILELQLREA